VQGRAQPRPAGWLRSRWFGLVSAAVLVFFAVTTIINPGKTAAVANIDPILSPALAASSDQDPAPTPTQVPPSLQAPLNQPGIAGSLNASVASPIVPTETITVPSATPVPAAATAPTATPIPSTAIPSGPTPTPDMGAPGNAVPVDGMIRVPVLMYHYIRVNPNPRDTTGFGLSVTPADFAAQIDWLVNNGYHAVFPSELYAALTQGAPLPTKPIVLTFDDGYRDFYDQAWPVLKQAGMKSSSAVITAYADKGDRGDQMYMAWWQIRELDKSGMVEFASHTQFHGNLAAMTAAQRWTELTQSKATIEQQLGHPCLAIVYPSGQFNGAVVADSQRAGYQIAFTTQSGKVRVPQDGGLALQLPRVRVAGGTSLPNFIRNLA
jgi:peptidoglycan/xylan/chitin deacetylase (PgdA/CDA1 family)